MYAEVFLSVEGVRDRVGDSAYTELNGISVVDLVCDELTDDSVLFVGGSVRRYGGEGNPIR